MTKNRFFKYVFVNDSENGTRLDVVRDAKQYELETGKDTVRFFKSFGKCYFRRGEKCDTFYTECNGAHKTYRYYNTLAELIKAENLYLVELPATTQASFYGKAHIILDKNGINKGLQSYDELVAIFEAGERILFTGYFSQTTTRHQDAYAFPNPCYYRYNSETTKINKKFLDTRSSLYFAN